MAFGKAFAAARKAGKKEFTYQGKKYNTKLAVETPKKAPTPTARPTTSAPAAKPRPTPDKEKDRSVTVKRPPRRSSTTAPTKPAAKPLMGTKDRPSYVGKGSLLKKKK